MPLDFTVEGGVFIEADEEEVKSLERALSGAANKATKAASGAEAMEKGVDSATEAAATLAGVSEDLDSDLQNVEDELEDIVTDSGAAAGSLQILNASMESIDEADIDMDVDDAGIDAINEKWQRMRNEINDFEHRVDDVIPRGAGGGAPAGDFLGDRRNFEQAMDTLDDAQESMNEIADARERAMGDDDETLNPFRQIEDSSIFRKSLSRDLEPFGDRDTVNAGQLRPSVEASDTAGDLARRLKRGRATGATDFGEILEAVTRAADVSDEVTRVAKQKVKEANEALEPVGDIAEARRQFGRAGRATGVVSEDQFVRGMPRAPGGLGVSEAHTFGLPQDMEEMADQTFEPLRVDEDRSFEEQFGVPMEEVFSDDVLESVRSVNNEMERLDEQSSRTARSVTELDLESLRSNMDAFQQFERAASADLDRASRQGRFAEMDIGESLSQSDLDLRGQLRENIDDVFRSEGYDLDVDAIDLDGAETIGDIGQEVEAQVDVEGQQNLRMLNNALSQTARQAGVTSSMEKLLEEQTESLDRDSGKLSRTWSRLSAAVGASSTAFGAMIAFLKSNEEEVEELDDDVEDLARSLSSLAPALSTLSANLGPFNIGLTNLAVTIPALVGTVGPLIVALLGLAGALVAVVGAFGALLAVGAIQFAEDLKNNFAGIETTGEAVMAIMRGLKNSILEALQPLEGVSIGGIGGQGLFVTVLRDIVELIHLFAEAAAELLNMDVVEDFLLNMRAAVLGFESAGLEGISMIEGLKRMVASALPIFEGMLIWFIDVLPEAMAFAGQITSDIAPALASLSLVAVRLFTTLTEIGTGALNILIPGLVLAGVAFATLLDIAQAITDAFGPASDLFFAITVSVLLTAAAVLKLSSALVGAARMYDMLTEAVGMLNGALNLSSAAMQRFKAATVSATMATARFLGGVLLIVGGLHLLRQEIKPLDDFLTMLTNGLTSGADAFYNMAVSMGAAVGMGEEVKSMLNVLIGTMMLAAGVASIYAIVTGGSMVGALSTAITAVGGLIVAFGHLIAEKIALMLADAGLITMTTGLNVALDGLAVSAWSAVSAMSALQLVTGVLLITAIALLASEMLGFTNILSDVEEAVLATVAAITVAFLGSGWGAIIVAVGLLIAALIKLEQIVGPVAAGVIAAIGAITAAFLGSGWGAIIVAIGLAIAAIYMLGKRFGFLKVAAIAAIGAITAALVGSGWGAIIVAIGLALLLLAEHWGTVKKVAEDAMQGLVRLLDIILWKVDEFVAGLLRAVGLLKDAKALAPVPGALGESNEGSGLGSIFAKTAAGAAAGGVAGSIIPGAGTVGGAVVGGLAGLADATVLQEGGYVREGGMAFLHSDEFVIPADKAKNAFADADIGMDPQVSGGPSGRTGGGGGGTNVNVNIQNGNGEIDDRRARQIGRITRRTVREQRRYEDGR